MRENQQNISTDRKPSQHRSRYKNFLPFILFGAFALFIALNESPDFRHAMEYYVAPERWQAGETCESKALQLGSSPDYMRIIEHGDVHKTEKGFLIKNIIVGEMAQQGGEQQFVVDCYTDPSGNLVRADRR